MSIFDTYCEDADRLLNRLREDIGQFRRAADSGQEDSYLLKTIEGNNKDLTALFKECDIEIRSNSANERKIMNERMQRYKDAQKAIAADLEACKFKSQKGSLTGGSDARRKAESQQ